MFNPIWLYPISFLVLLLSIKNKKNRMIYTVLVMMYLFSAICAVYIYYNLVEFGYKPIYWSAVLYHIVITLLLLSPISKIDKLKSLSIPKVTNNSLFHFFTIIVIFLCLWSIFISWQNIDFNVLLNNSRTLRVFESNESKSFIGYIKFFGTRYSSLALVLAFYYILHEPNRRVLIVLLFICSLSSVISGMQVAAREYVVKYFFLSGILYLFCKKGMSASWNRKMIVLGIVVAVLGSFLFMLITFSRFGGTSSGYVDKESTWNSLLNYYGQGFVNFSEFFQMFSVPVKTIGSIYFPFFSRESMSAFDLNSNINANITLNVFPTSLGSWILDGGVLFATIVAIILVLLISWLMRMKINVFKVYYVIWFCDYMFSYLFFFNDTFNGSRLMSIAIIIAFDIFETQSSKRSSDAYLDYSNNSI